VWYQGGNVRKLARQLAIFLINIPRQYNRPKYDLLIIDKQ